MVSSHLSGLTKSCKAFHTSLLLPDNPTNAVPTDDLEFDFSDVFGPVSAQLTVEVDEGHLETADDGVNELVYDDPAVLHRRSHSLVGPSACISQSLKLSKLSINETEEANVFLDYVSEAGKNIRDVLSDDNTQPLDMVQDTPKMCLEDLEILKLVGQGAFGKVYQVRKKGTSDIYAMKVMRKDKIMEKNHAGYMKAERDILTKIDHPFIVQLRYSFQTKYRLYLVLDFINGGHLFFQLYNQGLFREDLARVYAAEIVSAVSHLHANGVMHRDLKPENILLDADGHVVLTDFGLAKELEENERSNSLCGTVEYMAPEIILGKGHDKAADWWSVGVLIFEMLTGQPPFSGGNREKIQKKITKEKFKLPSFLTSEAHSLLKGLMQKDASKRLGSGVSGSEEVKHHKWFKPINWRKLDAREIQPSFRPEVAGKLCTANFEKHWTDMPLVVSPAASPNGNGNLVFKDFSYVRPAASFLQKMSPSNERAVTPHPKSLSTFNPKPVIRNSFIPLLSSSRSSFIRCKALADNIVQDLAENAVSLPVIGPGFAEVQRLSETLPDTEKWGFAVFAGVAWLYLTARPGVLIGFIDAYILAPLQVGLDSLTGKRRFRRSDFLITGKLGEGSFGVVYAGVVVPRNVNVEDSLPKKGRGRALDFDKRFKEKVILKQVKLGVEGAKECGDFEEWFNYRLSRAAPETCAEFLGSFVADKTNSQYTKGGKCLVWKFEGDQDLADYMKDRNFPLNLESIMFGRVLEGLNSLERNALIIKQILRQIITSLKKIHDTGIVHRDVKPANLVVTKKGQIKLIDFGAAADLRIGKNYVPDRGLLDPDYCPPELYVLPEETPSPPPEPIAALFSPILWQLNSPDLFDMYSAGIVLMQMAVPSLRSTAGLKNFNTELKGMGYDLNSWRERTRTRPDLRILDLDKGRGWDLATKLISERGYLRRGRLSASAALRHPYFLLGGDQAAAVLSKLSLSR